MFRKRVLKSFFSPSSKYLRKEAAVGFGLVVAQLLLSLAVLALETNRGPVLGWVELPIRDPTFGRLLYQTSNLATASWLFFWTMGLASLMFGATRLDTPVAVLSVPTYFVAASLPALWSTGAPTGALVLYLGLVIAAWLYVRSRTKGRRRLWMELRSQFLLWLVLSAIPTVLIWQDPSERAIVALRLSSVVLLIAIPFWFALALESVGLGIDLGKVAWRAGAKVFAQSPWKHAVGIVLLVALSSLALSALPANGIRTNFMIVGAVIEFAILALLIRSATHAPNVVDNARRFGVLGVAIFLLSLAVWAGSLGRDFREHLVAVTGLVPSAIVCLLLITYQPLRSGTAFAEGHSKRLPKDCRAPLYFGVALLAAGALYFYLSWRAVDSGDLGTPLGGVLDRATGVGVLVLGFPYLSWLYLTKRGPFGVNRASAVGGTTHDRS